MRKRRPKRPHLNGSVVELDDLFLDETKETEGVWVPLFPGNPKGPELLVARAGNPRHIQVGAELIGPLLEKHGSYEAIPKEELETVEYQSVARAVFLGFRGIVTKGKPVENSEQIRLKMVAPGGSSEIRMRVTQVAGGRAHYHRKYVEEIAGN